MDKREIRKTMKARRRALTPARRAALSAAICRELLARDDVRAAMAARQTFAVYLASPEEVDLSGLIARLWAADCPVAVPAWRDGTYVLARYACDTALVAGPMGIREPSAAGDPPGDSLEPAVWIVPGLAFTAKGARLGYGGGWYDRFLSAAAPGAVAIGVAYPFQIVAELPVEPHDIALTAVVAPRQTDRQEENGCN